MSMQIALFWLEWTDEKTTENLVHLYTHGGTYEARYEAIEKLSLVQDDPEAYAGHGCGIWMIRISD